MTLDLDVVRAALPAYDIGEELGRGAFGVVLAGTHRHLGRAVAIKQLATDAAIDDAIRARFLAEARVLASMDHPHIVPIFDFVDYQGVFLLVMEHLPGGTLWDLMRGPGVDDRFACAATLAASSGLEYAHRRGVLHRDIKPENLMFSADGVLKVADFGIAKVMGAAMSAVTRAGSAVGTPAYMAPEQAQGRPVSAAADVYALGTVLYEMVSGRLPYPPDIDPVALLYQHVHEDPPPIAEVADTVPVPIAAVIDRSITRSLDIRYASAAGLAAALSEAVAQAWGPAWDDGLASPVHDRAAMTRFSGVERAVSRTVSGTAAPTVAVVRPQLPVVRPQLPVVRPQLPVVRPPLPSGVVTLLFTDIEGSTKAWEAHPKEMKTALARHDEILRTHIEASGGYVFKTVGDAFCATFQEASVGIAAAVAIQRSLATERWPEATPIRVRMALHTGTCDERGGDYFGPVVNRTARLEAVAHGGQLVVSGLTAELVSERLPPGVSLRDLGEHRLKDLGRAEQVFQVCGEGLTPTFPPLRSLDNPGLKHNLAEQVSSFVGRDREVADITGLLRTARLVTLAGPGGVGKTRLALQAAAESLDGSGDGVWFVDLAPVTDPGLVPATVAKVLWVNEQAGHPLTETLVDAIGERRMMVVLDNCEQVVTAAAALADTLLRRCHRIVMMATSREPLGIAGEQVYRVPSLSLPDPNTSDPAVLARCEAVRLFVERAAQQKPGFALDAENARVVARLCRRLDGIPFAIELATARLRSMSVRDLEARLDRRFRLLTGGSRTALPRQQTLQALIDFSWDLLSPTEKVVLARLSVFAGGFDMEGAEAVCPGGEVEDFEILDILDTLVVKSLVQADDSTGTARYRLLETMREYAQAKLAERASDELGVSEQAVADRAHRDYFLALAEKAATHIRGAGGLEWADRLDIELDNVRVALSESLADPDAEPGLRFGDALSEFWDLRGYGVEGVDALRAMLDRPSAQAPTPLRGRALAAAARLVGRYLNDYPAAVALAEEALTIADATGDDALAAKALFVQARARRAQGDQVGCLAIIDVALPLARRLRDPRSAAHLLNLRGYALSELGDESRPSFEESIALYRRAGDRTGVAVVLANMGSSALAAGDLDTARGSLGEAARVFRELGNHRSLAVCVANEGAIAYLDGNAAAADRLFHECLDTGRRMGVRRIVAYAILGLAVTATLEGDAERAATLHGVFDANAVKLEALETRMRADDLDRLRTLLGDGPYDQAYQAGRSLSLDDALTLANRASDTAYPALLDQAG